MKPSRYPYRWPVVRWDPRDIALGFLCVVVCCYGVAVFVKGL